MKSLKELIESKITQKGFTKTLIYNELGMTRTGFEYALKNETLKLKDFYTIAKILTIEPNYFFEWNKESELNVVSEPIEVYGKHKSSSTINVSEVEFLREQVKELTQVIVNLSQKNN